MTKTELLGKVTSVELTEWMGLQTLRKEEAKEAQAAQGPATRSIRQPRATRRR